MGERKHGQTKPADAVSPLLGVLSIAEREQLYSNSTCATRNCASREAPCTPGLGPGVTLAAKPPGQDKAVKSSHRETLLSLLFLPDHNNFEATSDFGMEPDCGFVRPQLSDFWQVHQLFVQFSAGLTLNSIYHFLLCHTAKN